MTVELQAKPNFYSSSVNVRQNPAKRVSKQASVFCGEVSRI